MNVRRVSLCVAVGCSLALCASASGASSGAVLAEFYGAGVHQYFSGNYGQAVSTFTAAINGGTRDPRAYYFRALAAMQSGAGGSDVEADLRKGAALESADADQFYAVGRSLERVQGSARMTLERYRALARAEAYTRRHDRDLLRYEQRRRAETDVLRRANVAPVPPADLIPAPAPALAPAVVPPPLPAADDNPFDEAPAVDEPADAVEPPAADEEMAAEDAPAADAAPPADDNPFVDEPDAAK
ncbi:MAG TPA: hypothetical protein VGJ16_03805 [Pirellulales bacterium]|jgi:hypothetical protein